MYVWLARPRYYVQPPAEGRLPTKRAFSGARKEVMALGMPAFGGERRCFRVSIQQISGNGPRTTPLFVYPNEVMWTLVVLYYITTCGDHRPQVTRPCYCRRRGRRCPTYHSIILISLRLLRTSSIRSKDREWKNKLASYKYVMLVSHYSESPGDPLRIPPSLHALTPGGSAGDLF